MQKALTDEDKKLIKGLLQMGYKVSDVYHVLKTGNPKLEVRTVANECLMVAKEIILRKGESKP